MARLTYIGPHDGVWLETADGQIIEAARGASIDVPDDLAGLLLEQRGNWKKAAKAAKED